MRRALIVAQTALALVLLTGSGLMLRSFARLTAVEPGVRTDNVLTLGVSFGANADPGEAVRFYGQVLEEVAALPGAVSVGATNSLPLHPTGLNGGSVDIESLQDQQALPPTAMWTAVTPGLFETLGVPLRQGRAVAASDDERAAPAVWVNEEFVRRHLPERDPLRERIRIGGPEEAWRAIAGVVGDVRTFGLAEDVSPMVYLPLAQARRGVGLDLVHLVVRTSGPPVALLPQVRAVVSRIRGEVPLTEARTMAQILDDSVADSAFTMTVLAIAAIAALLLGAIGLYGVIAYVVAQRTREIGVRLALGAPPASVRRMVVGQGVVLVLLGALIGVVAAWRLTQLMRGILFEVSPFDPLVYGAGLLLLLGVSVLAAWLPASRASRTDVMHALRAE